MSNAQITLNQFFSFKEKKFSQDRLAEIGSSETISLLKENILKKAKEIKWSVAFNEIMDKVEDLLNIGIHDIMVCAWNKYRVLLKYLDRKKYPRDETFLVPLAEHTIKSVHHPYIEILVNDKVIGKIKFDISISLKFKGITLKIKNAKIMEILTGTCKGKGTIKCEKFVIIEKETESFSLPGSINLGAGIAIAA